MSSEFRVVLSGIEFRQITGGELARIKKMGKDEIWLVAIEVEISVQR